MDLLPLHQDHIAQKGANLIRVAMPEEGGCVTPIVWMMGLLEAAVE
jgi:hypothetical protein